jgi:hypothetical protein
MNGKLHLGVPIALLVVAVASGVGAAAASPDTPATQTLTVIVKNYEARVVDLAPPGPSHGDLRVFNGPLYNEDETEVIGRLDGFCVLTDPADDPSEQQRPQCLLTFSLPDGAITVQGVQPRPALTALPASETIDAITGGTGAYQTARGERHIRVEGETIINTFSLILRP